MYSAATAMQVATRSHDINSHNLAHSSVPGYRNRGVVFQTFDRALNQAAGTGQPLAGADVDHGYSDFTPGTIHYTGSSLDVALSGDGFFVLQGTNGPLYTRNGVFHRQPDGQLVNAGGLPVLGQSGPITIPAQAANIAIADDGSVSADGNPVDRIQVMRFNNRAALSPAGITLFQAPNSAGAEPGQDRVLQGAREQSNVPLAGSMVTMVRDMRYFEASQRALKTLSDASQLVTRPA